MLVVVAILLVLAMLLLRSFDFAIRRSETVRCMNSMRQIGAALHAYRNDHDGWLPPGFPEGGSRDSIQAPPGMSFGSTRLLQHLLGYLTEQNTQGALFEIPFCPGGLNSLTTRIAVSTTQWNDERASRQRASYGLNSMLVSMKFDQVPPPRPMQLGTTQITLGQFPSREAFDPSRYPFLLEVYSYGDHISTWNFVHQNQALTGRWGFENDSANRTIRRSHSGNPNGAALNFLFMAGNIETISRNYIDETSTHDAWEVGPNNPGGMFHHTGMVPAGISGRTAGEKIYFPHNGLANSQYKLLYPQFSTWEGP